MTEAAFDCRLDKEAASPLVDRGDEIALSSTIDLIMSASSRPSSLSTEKLATRPDEPLLTFRGAASIAADPIAVPPSAGIVTTMVVVVLSRFCAPRSVRQSTCVKFSTLSTLVSYRV